MTKSGTIVKPSAKRRKVSEFQKAYIAGFLDAKAMFNINHAVSRKRRNESWVTHVTVNSSDIKPLRMLQEVYGGYIKLLDRSELGYKPEYRLEIKDKHDIVSLIKDVLPYLLLKRKVAQLLLQYCDSRLKALQYVENPVLAPISNEEKKLAKQIISLNKSER